MRTRRKANHLAEDKVELEDTDDTVGVVDVDPQEGEQRVEGLRSLSLQAER